MQPILFRCLAKLLFEIAKVFEDIQTRRKAARDQVGSFRVGRDLKVACIGELWWLSGRAFDLVTFGIEVPCCLLLACI